VLRVLILRILLYVYLYRSFVVHARAWMRDTEIIEMSGPMSRDPRRCKFQNIQILIIRRRASPRHFSRVCIAMGNHVYLSIMHCMREALSTPN